MNFILSHWLILILLKHPLKNKLRVEKGIQNWKGNCNRVEFSKTSGCPNSINEMRKSGLNKKINDHSLNTWKCHLCIHQQHQLCTLFIVVIGVVHKRTRDITFKCSKKNTLEMTLRISILIVCFVSKWMHEWRKVFAYLVNSVQPNSRYE